MRGALSLSQRDRFFSRVRFFFEPCRFFLSPVSFFNRARFVFSRVLFFFFHSGCERAAAVVNQVCGKALRAATGSVRLRRLLVGGWRAYGRGCVGAVAAMRGSVGKLHVCSFEHQPTTNQPPPPTNHQATTNQQQPIASNTQPTPNQQPAITHSNPQQLTTTNTHSPTPSPHPPVKAETAVTSDKLAGNNSGARTTTGAAGTRKLRARRSLTGTAFFSDQPLPSPKLTESNKLQEGHSSSTPVLTRLKLM